ncbi:hypothetical protein [Oceanicoccus sagamiensis]|uniref:Uncharacterized protein n=1 Tax=Oceanicoccus sagamiensis TaxID=716816 RepID=A0A1X9N6J5_9GAMM|nr:hypothetical protein [Oceanicoccus sagamiensis]ARN72871.1 hypothetical protein BST96_01370 [Oceanicoccus sagamiensis]
MQKKLLHYELLFFCLMFLGCAGQDKTSNQSVIYNIPSQSSNIKLTANNITSSDLIQLNLPMPRSLINEAGMQATLLSELDSNGRGNKVMLPLAEPDIDNETVLVSISTEHLTQGQEYLLLVRTTHKYFNPNRRYFISIGE